MWIFLLFPLLVFGQENLDLSAIDDLEASLPDHEIRRDAYRNIPFERAKRNFRHPERKISLEEIRGSGTEPVYLKAGTILHRAKDDRAFRLPQDVFTRAFASPDEQGFKYITNKKQEVLFYVNEKDVEAVAQTSALFEPPLYYSPAINVVKTEYDKKLRLSPEAAVYVGVVQGQFIRDLFNDPEAKSGITNQYAFHYFTEWDLPLKVGASVHFERSSYKLARGGNVFYEALSFGPQFRTKDFEFFETNWRVTTQIRVSPFARLEGETTAGNVEFKFNSTDLMTTLEHPWENRWGQFVVGGFHQIQWLNLKDQPEIVSIRASNQTNQSFGLFLAQVFQ